MNIRKKFLELTKWTYPFGTEHLFEKYLPKGIKKDEFGNYYLKCNPNNEKIDTIFTSHIDTACKKYQKVKHLETKKLIFSRNSILGADNKAGVTIMLYMIENKIPGLYYFFIGEEVGRIGSRWAAIYKNFENYKKVISFDRKGKESLVTFQSKYRSCSNMFADNLINLYSKHGINLKKDPNGSATDSKSFMEIIPECTNISVGYNNQHTIEEYIDIEFLEKIAKASLKIEWNKLKVYRDPCRKEKKFNDNVAYGYKNHYNGSGSGSDNTHHDHHKYEYNYPTSLESQSYEKYLNSDKLKIKNPFNKDINKLLNINKKNNLNKKIKDFKYLRPFREKLLFGLSLKEKRKIKKKYLL